ncbi:MAG TPA: cytochrome c peroxidase [Gemmatimonadales bacterium]|nr:cytochrome c peroxidase [Gemmatimonadales bacterium]
MAAAGYALSRLALLLGALCTAPGVRAQVTTDRPAPLAGLDLYVPAPLRETPPEMVALGRRLFFDPVLSRDSTVSCAACHRPSRAFTDGKPRARGIGGRVGRRNAPTLLNRGYGMAFAWDGRGGTLAAQALRAIQDSAEMDLTVQVAVERLARHPGYVRAFEAAGGGPPSGAVLGEALAGYLRSIRSGDSRFDRFVAGDSTALNSLERRGLALFQGRARCDRCHTGPLLSDEKFHNTGVAWQSGRFSDGGRFEVTRRAGDLGAFKTPTLREVARTAPYMHDGSLVSLEEVVDFYARGGSSNPNLDPEIRAIPLGSGERAALVAFLRTLSGRVQEATPVP